MRALDRVFLRYVYTGLVSHLDDQDVSFELKHLFPVSRLKDEIPADSPGWPISCVANLALFTKALNREKTSQTISEYLAGNTLLEAEKNRLDNTCCAMSLPLTSQAQVSGWTTTSPSSAHAGRP